MLPFATPHLNASAKREDGFTLIEMLVVACTVGVLTAIAVPVFLDQRQKGNDLIVPANLEVISMTVQEELRENRAKQFNMANYPELQIDKDTQWSVINNPGQGWCLQVWNSTKSKDYTTVDTALLAEPYGSNSCERFAVPGTMFGSK
jgi:type II secretory pathway pseudopilin PulG